jgi:hypothetical protein
VTDAEALWQASGCAALTADGVPAPAALVHGVLDLVVRLDRRGAGLAERFTGAGLGVLAQRGRLLGLPRSGRVSCGGATRLVAVADGELAVALARESDHALVPAWLGLAGVAADGELGAAPAGALVDAAAELGLPVAAVGEVRDRRPVVLHRCGNAPERPLAGVRVVNLGSLWAGPLAAHLLARMGADVVSVESTTRPDGARATPAFFAALRDGVTGHTVDMDDRAELDDLLRGADVVIEGSRPRALRQLGIDADELARAGPQVWVSITAHGRAEPHARRVGFGDDAAAAGGLVGRTPAGDTVFLADAIADPLTGMTAAATVAELLERGGRYVADIALARVAAALADQGRTNNGAVRPS